MKTTHIGSLPFSDINHALEYNDQFDLPVLFSLPSLGKEYFMGFDLAFMLGILDGRAKNGKIIIQDNAFRNKPELTPFFLKEILVKMKGKPFKYQLVGPYTFYKMIEAPRFSFKDLCDFLAPIYLKQIKSLCEFGLELFSLDEPFFYLIENENKNYTTIFNQFLSNIRYQEIELSTHICSDIPESSVKKIESQFSLDFSTLTEDRLGYVGQTNIFGYSKGMINLQDFQGAKSVKCLENVYISPSCGLYGMGIEECDRVLSNLRNSKQLFIDRNLGLN